MITTRLFVAAIGTICGGCSPDQDVSAGAPGATSSSTSTSTGPDPADEADAATGWAAATSAETTEGPLMCTTPTPEGFEDVLATYFEVWAEADAPQRLCLLAQVWNSDARYVDPSADATGPEAFSTVVEGFHRAFPGSSFEPSHQFDRYTPTDGVELFRLGWSMLNARGEPTLPGMDFGFMTRDGRIGQIVGFFGPMAPGDANVTMQLDNYGAAWNETDPRLRQALLAQVLTPDAVYTDPSATREGPAGVDATIAAFQEQFPGARLVRVTDLDRHHDWGRYGWEIRQGRTPLLEGVDFVQFAEDGRLRSISGFFGAPQPLR